MYCTPVCAKEKCGTLVCMNPDIQQRLDTIEAKVDATYTEVRKTRKIFQVILWVTIIAFVLPAIGLVFAIPTFINTYTTTLNGLM